MSAASFGNDKSPDLVTVKAEEKVSWDWGIAEF